MTDMSGMPQCVFVPVDWTGLSCCMSSFYNPPSLMCFDPRSNSIVWFIA